jgi:hypothetical protein
MLYLYLIGNARSTPQCFTVLYVTLRSCSKIRWGQGSASAGNNATYSLIGTWARASCLTLLARSSADEGASPCTCAAHSVSTCSAAPRCW